MDRSHIISGVSALQGIQKLQARPATDAEIKHAAQFCPGSVTPAAGPPGGQEIVIKIPGSPIGKPRMTQRDKWKKRPCVLRYREWADKVRDAAGTIPSAGKVRSLSWVATFVPPDSWSKKKRDASIGTLHRSKPDRDNIDKAVLDILYPGGDSAIALGSIEKRWGEMASLVIFIQTE